MSFTLATNVPTPSPEERVLSLARTRPAIVSILADLQGSVTSTPPQELTCGVLLGYLRACGFPWTDAMTAMDEFLKISGATMGSSARPFEGGLSLRHAFQLELITCSVGCAPFLKTFLERNMRHFNRTIVVTDYKDMESRHLAQSMGANVLVTDRFYVGGKRFDRGSSYNRALKELKHRDFVVFADVDIVFPDDFRLRLERYGLKDDCFYGMARRDVDDEEQRKAFIDGKPFTSTLHLGAEWGFGYFQLFSPKSRFLQGLDPVYPAAEDVNHSDFLFRGQFGSGHTFCNATGEWSWDPVYQIQLPFECYHLGSNRGESSLVRHYVNPHGLPPLPCPPPPPVAAFATSLPPLLPSPPSSEVVDSAGAQCRRIS